MSESLEVIEYKGLSIKIYPDISPDSPRDWDNLGIMLCAHRRYNLGDKDTLINLSNYSSWDEIEKAVEEEYGKSIILPLYLYDHSGITISTKPFSCPWDSGRVGLIFAPYSKIRSEYSCKRISAKIRDKAMKVLEGEVATYDQYVRGEVYGYVVESNNRSIQSIIDDDVAGSCWGFYGMDYCISEAKSVADYVVNKAMEQTAKLQEAADAGATELEFAA